MKRKLIRAVSKVIASLSSRYGTSADWSADYRRRWKAAVKVTDGPASALWVAARLEGPRRSHALLEGHELHAGKQRETDET